MRSGGGTKGSSSYAEPFEKEAVRDSFPGVFGEEDIVGVFEPFGGDSPSKSEELCRFSPARGSDEYLDSASSGWERDLEGIGTGSDMVGATADSSSTR